MYVVLKDLVGTECWVFIDDVIIFSRSVQEHAQRLENVLQKFDNSNLKLHSGKCVFAQPQLNYLRFVLSEKGISVLPDKIKSQKLPHTEKRQGRSRIFWPSFILSKANTGLCRCGETTH